MFDLKYWQHSKTLLFLDHPCKYDLKEALELKTNFRKPHRVGMLAKRIG